MVMLPVLVLLPIVRLFEPEATVMASLAVTTKLFVFPTMLRSLFSRCDAITEALILAVPVT